MNKLRAWHFMAVPAAGEPPRLGYRDHRPVAVGKTITVDQPDEIEPCVYGLHASVDILDALTFKKGAWCSRVELGGRIIACPDGDKYVASERTVLAMADVSDALADWCQWALTAILDRGWPDAPEAIREWVATGKNGVAAGDAAGEAMEVADEGRYTMGAIYRIIPLGGKEVPAYELAAQIASQRNIGIARDEIRAGLLARILPRILPLMGGVE